MTGRLGREGFPCCMKGAVGATPLVERLLGASCAWLLLSFPFVVAVVEVTTVVTFVTALVSCLFKPKPLATRATVVNEGFFVSTFSSLLTLGVAKSLKSDWFFDGISHHQFA